VSTQTHRNASNRPRIFHALFASSSADPAPDRCFPRCIAYSAVASFALLKAIGFVLALKADKREEGLGLDVAQHGEEAYADDEGAILILPREDAGAPAEAPALAAAVAEGGRS
jgi:hypothetical protein